MPLPDGHMLARSYDRFGRPTGIALGADYQVAYAYDDVGRFAAITSAVNAVTAAVKYAYLAQSDLLAGWTVGAAPGVSNLIVRRSYEPRRDLVATVQVANATGTLARFVYVNDPLGRRVSRNDARTDGATVSNMFGYDIRSELEAAVMGTNQFGYQYDAIGNRQVAVANDQAVQYEANALNQYASILPAAGTPAYDADGNMTSDGTFIYSWDAENRLVEVRPAATNAGSKLTQSLYDYQGRRVGKRLFTWGTFAGDENWHWTESRYFTYDGWNPIDERMPARPTTMVPYIPASSTFLLGLGGQTAASSIWGLDLSGSLQGAGGVGGLLCHVRGGRPLFSFCDANGNMTGMVDTNGIAVAQYDYDPFGNLLAQSGDQADANPFRFSSKPWDEETGLYYYGYRFYSPSLGRWIIRDPIEEQGGISLYGFVENSSISRIDTLGLWGRRIHEIKTDQWAKEAGMRDTSPGWFLYFGRATAAVAWYCNGVDGGPTGPLPGQDQRYHFNRNGAGTDSRLQLRDQHLKAAKNKCDWSMGSDDYDAAADNLGLALHSVQDYVSHGDFFVGVKNQIKWPPHNGYSQADNVSGLDFWSKVHLVDDESLDAEGSSDHGRATKSVLQGNDPQKQWAKFVSGSERLRDTEQRTKAVISDFIDHVRRESKPCGACSQFFLP